MSDDSLSLILSSHGRTWDHLDVWLGTKPRSHEDREMDQHDVAVNEHGFIMIYSCQVMSAIKNIQFKQKTCPVVVVVAVVFAKGLNCLDGLWSPSLLRKETAVFDPLWKPKSSWFLVSQLYGRRGFGRCPKPTFVSDFGIVETSGPPKSHGQVPRPFSDTNDVSILQFWPKNTSYKSVITPFMEQFIPSE